MSSKVEKAIIAIAQFLNENVEGLEEWILLQIDDDDSNAKALFEFVEEAYK